MVAPPTSAGLSANGSQETSMRWLIIAIAFGVMVGLILLTM
jgi:hypothetical protein